MERYPREYLDDHLARLQWQQGEHLTIIGPTSSGKTTLAGALLPKRGWVVGMFSKARDKTPDAAFKGWETVRDWPRRGLESDQRRVMLWPQQRPTIPETMEWHADVFKRALDTTAKRGNRALYLDETQYLIDCGLGQRVSYLHYFARSAGISAVTSMQRPKFVPRIIMSSVTHAYIARTFDRDDIRRLSDLGGVNASELATNLAAITDRHTFVYVNPQGDARPSLVNTAWRRPAR